MAVSEFPCHRLRGFRHGALALPERGARLGCRSRRTACVLGRGAALNDEVTSWHSPAFRVSSAVLMSVYTEIAHAGGCASFDGAVLCLWRAGARDQTLILRRHKYAHLLHVGYPWMP